jgi:uncharacterized protein (TIGR04255 family)
MKPFPNAPLIEIIAEVHWRPSAQTAGMMPVNPAQPPPQVAILTDGTHEQFFSKMTSGLADKGFERVERLIPAGFPTLPYQPICRFKSGKNPSEVFQVGAGMFSVNGLKPYSSWEVFKPKIDHGIKLLIESKVENTPGPFTELILKYVDLFDASLLEGKTAARFLNEIAKFQFVIPPVITSRAKVGSKNDVNLSLRVSLAWGAELQMRIADGGALGKSGVIVETIVSIKENVPTGTAEILNCFEKAHDDIRAIFLDLTEPIHKLMSDEGIV